MRRAVTPGDTPNSTLRVVLPSQRDRYLSDTEKTLDDALRELVSLQMNISDDQDQGRHRHYSSNDSAMGESELFMSPVPSAGSEPSTLARSHHIHPHPHHSHSHSHSHSVSCNRSDSAFSNNTSPTNSSEGVNASGEMASLDLDSSVHMRTLSGVSTTSEQDRSDRIIHHPPLAMGSSSPHLPSIKTGTATSDTISLPTFSPERETSPNPSSHDRSVPNLTAHSVAMFQPHHKHLGPEKDRHKHKKRKVHTLPSVSTLGTYSPERSPVLHPVGLHFSSEVVNETSPQDDMPTPPSNSLSNHTDSVPSQGGERRLNSETSHGSSVFEEGTVV